MGYSDPNTDLHVEGVCVDFDRFLADLESVAGTTDDKCEEFPTEAYHAHMEDILTEAGLGRLKLPLLFFRRAGRMAFHSWVQLPLYVPCGG